MKAKGFTLMELLVVILIIGILAAFAIPNYLRSMEDSKADDAAALVNMVATTNRMYALDHNGAYVSGLLTSSCGSASCAGNGNACDLVNCKYLAASDYDQKPYVVSEGPGSCGSGIVACARRRTSGPAGASSYPYTQWGYNVDANGAITCTMGGAAVACGGDAPPSPTQ